MQSICPVEYVVGLISGKWKMSIVWELRQTRRFGVLERALPGIARRVLVRQLRELEDDGIVVRTVYPEVPPRVEYRLTDSGTRLLALFDRLSEWGDAHRGQARAAR
jgi:DNA-binding HxlR family transcriptional regulator